MRRTVALAAALALCGLMAVREARTAAPVVTLTVDVNAGRHPISPQIYGVAHAGAATLTELNVPLNRQGGNAETRYNWQLNASNRANDWFFESLAYGSATPGENADTFIGESRAAGAEPMITIPIIGWVANLGPGRARRASFSIAKYGAQTNADWQWYPDAGNGVRASNGQPITGNDPLDANRTADTAFQRGFVQHLATTWGPAAAGGVRYYILDNEPGIWHSTHRDVHPTGATMEEVRDRLVEYSAAVKAEDPGALTVGPEEWGWSGYIFSGYDLQWGSLHGWSGPFPDRSAHGNQDFLPWLLAALRSSDTASGRRTLDVFTVHYYPQGGEYSEDVSRDMQLLRNRSTRSLWDPSYVDESWIADEVRLIPLLKGWVAAGYPGLRIGITEYNWGAEEHMNGATAQADVLGVFGREGLDMANFWAVPAPGTPVLDAFRMYRNYDGLGGSFGETSVSAPAPDPDTLASFAAVRASDGALTVMLVHKDLDEERPVRVNLAGFAAGGPAQVWQLAAGTGIVRRPDVAASTSLNVTLPPQTVTLIVVPPSSMPTVSIRNASVTEGNTGTAAVSVNVVLSSAAAGPVSVGWATAAGGASAADFVAASGTVSFAPGTTRRQIQVAARGDLLDEATENFFVDLQSPNGVTIATGRGRVSIGDDDPLPSLSVTDATVTESDGAMRAAVFTVTLSAASGRQVKVKFGTANGTATAGSDYTALTGKTLTFQPGQTSKTVSVSVLPDNLAEADETFAFNLSAPVNATVADGSGLGTIRNDD